MRRLLFVTLLCGCGPADTDLEAAFCDILANGPEEDFAAGATEGSGPEVFLDGVNVELALNDGPDGYTGYATYTPDEAGSFAFGFKDDVGFLVLGADGTALPWEAEVRDAECADLAVRYTVALELKTYTLSFGPTPEPEADFVSEESDDDLAP